MTKRGEAKAAAAKAAKEANADALNVLDDVATKNGMTKVGKGKYELKPKGKNGGKK
jgi:hypothetical protein